jgi:pimeloyl-ACP methyl ester carboxylesterase
MSLRGHGGSDKSAGSYRIVDFAADAALLAEELALPPLTVVGHSLGSAVALRLAIDRPDLVRGLALAGAFADFADKPGLAEFVETTIAPLGDTVPRAVAQGFQRDTIAGPVADGLLDTMVDECLRTPAAVWRAAFAALGLDRFGDELDRVGVPVLLAWGDADAFTAEDDQRRLARGLRLAVRSIYQGTGHALHWEQPERFAEDLGRFVDRLGRARFSAAALAA